MAAKGEGPAVAISAACWSTVVVTAAGAVFLYGGMRDPACAGVRIFVGRLGRHQLLLNQNNKELVEQQSCQPLLTAVCHRANRGAVVSFRNRSAQSCRCCFRRRRRPAASAGGGGGRQAGGPQVRELLAAAAAAAVRGHMQYRSWGKPAAAAS